MPQAILLQDVESLGERGTVIDVSPGYLRNYLLPRKLAEPATTASIQVAKRRQEEAERAVREAEDRARDNAATLGRTVLTIPQQAGDDGRLFGSVTTQDIADAIRDARGIKIDRRKVHLEDPIRHTGTYMVVVEVTDEVTATVKTMVVRPALVPGVAGCAPASCRRRAATSRTLSLCGSPRWLRERPRARTPASNLDSDRP